MRGCVLRLGANNSLPAYLGYTVIQILLVLLVLVIIVAVVEYHDVVMLNGDGVRIIGMKQLFSLFVVDCVYLGSEVIENEIQKVICSLWFSLL